MNEEAANRPATADKDRAQRAEAERVLGRVSDEGGLFAAAGLRRMTDRTRAHLAADSLDGADRVEVWATRTGRILGLVLFVALAAWLIVTYVL